VLSVTDGEDSGIVWADSMADRISLSAPRGRSMELLDDDRGLK